MDWNTELTREVETMKGEIFRTLEEARTFVLKQRDFPPWPKVAGLLIKAAETGTWSDRNAATEAFRNALFIDGLRLKL